MKILIGTPIHEVKDYAMERWLTNVKELRAHTPADFLMVDNSEGLSYVDKVKEYCQKLGIEDYEIEHIEIAQVNNVPENIDEQIHERVARSRELIRQKMLISDYDAWFCWECDQLIPPEGLGKLVSLMQAGNFSIVDHNCWANHDPELVNFDFGVTLFSRECLEKYSFVNDMESNSLDKPASWYDYEEWYRKRLKRDGCKITEVEGLIEPVYHI